MRVFYRIFVILLYSGWLISSQPVRAAQTSLGFSFLAPYPSVIGVSGSFFLVDWFSAKGSIGLGVAAGQGEESPSFTLQLSGMIREPTLILSPIAGLGLSGVFTPDDSAVVPVGTLGIDWRLLPRFSLLVGIQILLAQSSPTIQTVTDSTDFQVVMPFLEIAFRL